MQYYEINEQTARRANDVNSMSDYRPGSATEEYRAAVDKAAALVQARKAKISPYYHDKLDALLDRYARRLADYYNAYYRNESACPSILVCGGSNFPVRKKQKQNARRESLWQEYKEIDAILDKIRSVGTGAVDLTDPHARELLQDRLQQEQNALDYCKAANAYYRKHKTLRGYASLTDQQADALTDPKPFPSNCTASPTAILSYPACAARSSAYKPALPIWTNCKPPPSSPTAPRNLTAARSCAMPKKTACKSCSTKSPTQTPATLSNPTVSAGRPATKHGSAS